MSGLQPLKKLFCIPCSPSKERGHSLSVLWVSVLDLLLAGRYYLCSQSVVATVIGSVPAQVSPPTRREKSGKLYWQFYRRRISSCSKDDICKQTRSQNFLSERERESDFIFFLLLFNRISTQLFHL